MFIIQLSPYTPFEGSMALLKTRTKAMNDQKLRTNKRLRTKAKKKRWNRINGYLPVIGQLHRLDQCTGFVFSEATAFSSYNLILILIFR